MPPDAYEHTARYDPAEYVEAVLDLVERIPPPDSTVPLVGVLALAAVLRRDLARS